MTSDGNLVLADGRRLSYAEFGDPAGRPVFYFHGAPSSRLEPLLIGDAAIVRAGLRVIAPDRPGMGRSDFQPNRGFSNGVDDVLALADALGIETFSVLGNSGGSGYAAACAVRIPQRLKSAAIVSGAWRMDWPEATQHLPFVTRVVWLLAARARWLLGLMLKAMNAASRGDHNRQLAEMKRRVPAPDYDAFETPGRLEAFADALHECLRQGGRGATWDMRLYVKPFDFDLAEIRMPLQVFHGELDANVPIALVRRALRDIPSATLVTYAHDAHLSTLCNHFAEIAEALT